MIPEDIPENEQTYAWFGSLPIGVRTYANSEINEINANDDHKRLSINAECFNDATTDIITNYVEDETEEDIDDLYIWLWNLNPKRMVSLKDYIFFDHHVVPDEPQFWQKNYKFNFDIQGQNTRYIIDIPTNKDNSSATTVYFERIPSSSSPYSYNPVICAPMLLAISYSSGWHHAHDWDDWEDTLVNTVAQERESSMRTYSLTHLGNNNFSYELQIRNDSPISKTALTLAQAQALPDVTLRQLQSAVYEIGCQFGRLDRTSDLFGGVELNHARLYPADDLYPANDLYPMSESERTTKSMYSKLWADEGNVHTFRNLIITYKTEEEDENQNVTEVNKTVSYEVNSNGTDDYIMDDNWLFLNLVWTDEEIDDYADSMIAKMQPLSWFPFDMDCVGLPYVETGDELEIKINSNTYTSYVLTRNMKGIQSLKDNMKNGELNIY